MGFFAPALGLRTLIVPGEEAKARLSRGRHPLADALRPSAKPDLRSVA